ncbi:putative membrane protein [Streptococcus gordonii]|uniref:cell division site-positioning protein MapZ family protein n=1 Tax=Streptococcus gordonii TaxID=1302 RepID=UPI000FA50E01|nr:putative membrane protein [Streptococcus gordonii]
MSKENKKPESQEQESILDFEEAKEMTIGQAARKSEELEAGVKEDDSVLDKYIKQHRQEIEAGKYTAAVQAQKKQDEQAEEAKKETVSTDEMKEEVIASPKSPGLEAEVSQAFSDEPEDKTQVDLEPVAPVSTAVTEDSYEEDDEKTGSGSKKVIYALVALLAVAGIAATAYFAMNRNQAGKTVTSSSSQASKKTSSSSSSSENSALKKFNDLYDSFFTDKNKLAIKNSSFANLDQLKTALEALKNDKEYTVAKAKYDNLVKQISAIQAVNSQFETAAIKDGVLDTNAKVKGDATFTETKTGNDNLDKLISSAISQGKGQQTVTQAAGGQGTPSNTAPAPAETTPTAPTTNNADQGVITGGSTGYGGLSSTGVPLQRNLSRVPYNQAVIDDVNNPAWVFNPGILEKILKISRERGYITGDQYIIERVNIIKGNGYYNLFKPDGTYLFSINCKTGYFVGNGPGYADSLDF